METQPTKLSSKGLLMMSFKQGRKKKRGKEISMGEMTS